MPPVHFQCMVNDVCKICLDFAFGGSTNEVHILSWTFELLDCDAYLCCEVLVLFHFHFVLCVDSFYYDGY